LLQRRLGGLEGRSVAIAGLKIGIASVLMAVAARLIWQWLLQAMPGTGEVERVTRVLLSIGGGLVVLAATAKILGVEEFDEASRRLWRRGPRPGADAP
jgi:hypothetical protein